MRSAAMAAGWGGRAGLRVLVPFRKAQLPVSHLGYWFSNLLINKFFWWVRLPSFALARGEGVSRTPRTCAATELPASEGKGARYLAKS